MAACSERNEVACSCCSMKRFCRPSLRKREMMAGCRAKRSKRRASSSTRGVALRAPLLPCFSRVQ
eukprot:6200985-Pleurochrysis_carterae.AAC.1